MKAFFEYLNSPEMLTYISGNHIFLISAVIIISSLKHKAYKSMWLAMLINLPGTFLHECAHFFVGLLLWAKPVRFSIFPKKSNDCYVMGQVGFANLRFYNALPSALAPLLLLFLAFYLNGKFFSLFPLNLGTYLLYIFVMTLLIENSIPSSTDLKQGFHILSGILLYLGLTTLAIVAFFN